MSSEALPPLSLYVHFPWCVRKCPYCDFNSHAAHGEIPQQAYIEALLRDLASQAEAVQGRPIHSIFFGGGTPSLFAPQAIAQLLEGVRAQLSVAADAEITLEANPGTIERGRFTDYRAAGVNRVSLGAQSFDAQQLQRLGRIHAADDTRRAVEELHAAGIQNFNLDLMYALPQQQEAGALTDLDTAIALRPAHLSHYQLTLEPGTIFGARPPPGLPEGDQAADMQLACQARLAEAGYAQYEVSAYARPGRGCRHNLNYWEFGDYLGIGAGAHGKRSRWHEGGLEIERSTRPREPRRYLAALAQVVAPAWQPVAAAELPFEYLLNTLRLRAGFEPAAFEARTGLSLQRIVPTLARAERRGLMERSGETWRASERGYHLLNALLTEFLPASAPAGAAPA